MIRADSRLHQWSDLVAVGVSQREVRERLRTGSLERVRVGVYAAPVAESSAVISHRRLVDATWSVLRPGATISHFSAATLHGLPVPASHLDRVWITRPGRSGKIEHQLHLCRADLGSADIVLIDRKAVTSLERTSVDVIRRLGLEHGVMVLDAALRAGADPSTVAAMISDARGRRGSGRCRAVFQLADGRSESPGESLSRVVLWRQGVPSPDLQVEIHDEDGLAGRVDFGWRAQRVVGEFDGRVKYGRDHARGGDPAEELWREKLREDRLRRAGWMVVRWTWADLARPERLAARVTRALETNARPRRHP